MLIIDTKILHTLKKIKIILIAVLLIKLHVLMINLANQFFFTDVKMQFIVSLMQFFKCMITAKK